MILPSDVSLTRLALHASALDLPHPADGRRVRAAAPWPADRERLVARLDRQWTAEGVD
jgi:hypothetical protein